MSSGIVFDIQRFSIHDGPGIRTIVFLKGCPLRCLWCANPESQRLEPELFYIPGRCIRCDACFEACPAQAVRRDDYTEGRIDRGACILCGACVEVCPTGALSMKGKRMGVDEVYGEVLKDRQFYASSGGGVTFSGGEPFLQVDFLQALLERMKAGGIDTVVETAGDVPWCAIERCLPFLDHILFDLKAFDPERHRRIVGTGNKRILENLEKLSSADVDMAVRIPVVPGVNDDEEDMKGLARLIASLSIRSVEFLAYHELGVTKYGYLDRVYPLEEKADGDPEKSIRRLAKLFGDYGVKASGGSGG